MKASLIIIGVMLISFIGAVAHEEDIYRACEKYGESHYTMWTKTIECKPINKRD